MVFIAGLGVISALGNNVSETISSFEKHNSGIDSIKNLKTKHRNVFPVGEVKLSNKELSERAGIQSEITRTILLSYLAARESMAGFEEKKVKNFKTGFISGSTVGGMDKTEAFTEDFIKDPDSGNLNDVINHCCGTHTDFVAGKLGIRNFVTTISTACSSSANSIMLGARMIKSGMLDIAVCGGVDALTKFTLNGFNSLMIVDKNQCRPLDSSRVGLNLGEGAAYLVLVNEKVLKELNADVLCTVSGYANTNDSFHQTALSDEGNGPFLAMEAALKMSGLKPSEIDYINMHGTGTINNDAAEGRALERIFHPNYPKLSSTKSFTGHSLGASGAMEAVFSALAIKEGILFPNFSFNESVKGLNIVPEIKFQRGVEVNHVLSNSFGFGGNCTSLIFSKI